MTKQEVQAQIDTWIVQNGVNSITANVLRPVLNAILNQPNDLVGVLSALNTTSKVSIVSAINEIAGRSNGGIKVHTGTANPNVTAPTTFVLGDFYNRTSNGNTVNFYQYNGLTWVEIAKSTGLVLGSKKVSASHTIVDGDHTVIYAGTNTADRVNIPTALEAQGRVILVSNTSNVAIQFNRNYLDNTRVPTSVIVASKVTTIQSDGNDWYKIN